MKMLLMSACIAEDLELKSILANPRLNCTFWARTIDIRVATAVSAFEVVAIFSKDDFNTLAFAMFTSVLTNVRRCWSMRGNYIRTS